MVPRAIAAKTMGNTEKFLMTLVISHVMETRLRNVADRKLTMFSFMDWVIFYLPNRSTHFFIDLTF